MQMNRYDGQEQEEGYFQEDEEAPGESQEEVIIDMQTGFLEAMELDLAEQGLNQDLLKIAIELAKQDIWWFFRSTSKRVRRVERIYRRLTGLVRETIEKEEEE
jgi:hypothetical protein